MACDNRTVRRLMLVTANGGNASKSASDLSSSRAGGILCLALGYSYMHSGVRCQHLLCHHLNRLGYRAYIGLHGRQVTNASLNTPAGDLDMLEQFRRDGVADIVIYPEVTQGNPLNAQRVVRYLLNRPGFFT